VSDPLRLAAPQARRFELLPSWKGAPARDPVPTPAAAIVERVRSEFGEMCGFSPTAAQAARLFGLPPDECVVVLDALVREGFLSLGSDGLYHVKW